MQKVNPEKIIFQGIGEMKMKKILLDKNGKRANTYAYFIDEIITE